MTKSRINPQRLVEEAMAGVTQASSRSALTIVGTALGIASFIAVLGVTSSANAQISRDFDQTTATQVVVQPLESTGSKLGAPLIPSTAEASVFSITGVTGAGTSWDVPVESVSALPAFLAQTPATFRVLAVSPGYWDLVNPTLYKGRVFDDALNSQAVAVVGQQLAASLNVLDVENSPTVFVNGQPLTVIGIVSDSEGGTAPLAAITVPAGFARAAFGEPGVSESLRVETAVGATEVVASQLAIAIDSRHPERFTVLAPPHPTIVRDQVSNSVQALFLLLALVSLVVGAVGITNASLIGVISRIPEIGLRRSLGARPRHIAAQFLLESAVRGLLGGTIGSTVGLLTVILIAITQQWTAVVQPWTIFLAPLVGALVGALAGLYPAARASRIEPIEAFRR